MSERVLTRYALTVVVFAVAWAVPTTWLKAEPKPEQQDKLIAEFVCGFLKNYHLNKPEIGDDISRKLFKKFLKDMDPAKLYFTKEDVDEFRKQETELDDMLLKGDLSFAFKVYGKYVDRLTERQKMIDELVKAKYDFTDKESIDTDYDKIDYVKNDAELRDRWRKRIKFDLLMQRIGDKPVGEEEAKEKVLSRYQGQLKRWKQLDNADLLELYLTDLTSSADPHSTYMSPATLDDFEIAMRLNLDGIGAILRSENGNTSIVEIVAGGAAAADGRLKPNDKIVGVAQGDGEFVDISDMKLRDAVKLIRGKRGTKVRLKVVPVGKIEPVVYELMRQKIEMKSQEARGEIVDQGKKPDGKPYRIGIIDLPSFYADMSRGKEAKSATVDVRKILEDFNANKVDGVVLDLRHNGGGSLAEALALTGLFIDEGPVVQVRDADGVKSKNDPEKGIVYNGPLVVLVSRLSASASEILAGALQDYGRALVVGDSSTHGKGTVQTIIDLGSQVRGNVQPKLGALKLTIQQFFLPNGDSTQINGVHSDIVLPSLTEFMATEEKELDYALPFDKVEPAKHIEMNLVPADLKKSLRERSSKRVTASAEFAKQNKDIELFKIRKARKSLPLNEKDLREQFSKDEVEKIDRKDDETDPDLPKEGTPYKFKRNFTNNEILQIMQDLIERTK